MRKFSNLSKIVSLAVILLFTYTSEVFALTPAPAPRKMQTPQEKRQQLQQDAATAMTEVDTAYKEILTSVNSGQAPSAEILDKALKAVAKNRKYLPVLNDSQKSTYHILSAWVFYFDNKQDKAAKQAASAQKVAPKNPNTVKTRFAISVIYKDYTSVIEALTEQSTNTRPRPQTGEPDAQSYQQGSENDIQLDVNAVRIELLSKVFDFQPEPVEADSPSWQSAGRLNCALLWKIDVNELDSFAPIEVAKPAQVNEPNVPPQEPNLSPAPLEDMPVSQPDQEAASESQPQAVQIPELEVFSKLQTQFPENKKIAFSGINLNSPTKTKNLANWLKNNPQTWQTFILSTQGQQKMLSSLGSDLDKPVLLIIAPDGTIRYAGNVEGFLPQMVINNILQNPLEFAEPNEPNKPPVTAEPNLPAAKPARQTPLEPNKPDISPILLIADANKAVPNNTQQQRIPPQTDVNTASPPVKQQQADEAFSAADDYQAEKLLSNAGTFLQIGNKLPSHAYRDPIDWCRQVMKNYPNTKYAQEAQMLLRNVPKEHRQQYNLTDEELGL